MNWHTASLSEIKLLQSCAVNNNFFANNYSAVNCILYQNKFNSKIMIQNGWIFERYENNCKFCFSFPHKIEGYLPQEPSQAAEITDILQLHAKEAKEEKATLYFHNVTLAEKNILTANFPNAKVEEASESGDYIYLTENLGQLPGSKYSKKRNHINQFKKKYADFHFEALNENNLTDARLIEEKWLLENTDSAKENGSIADLEAERKIISFALDNFGTFKEACEMAGGILYVEKTPVAFCLASRLSGDVTDIHFEKCLSPFARDGGYAVINNAFAKTVTTKFINREEDLGIEGLRKAKLSYYPEKVLEKFFVIIDSE